MAIGCLMYIRLQKIGGESGALYLVANFIKLQPLHIALTHI